MAPKSRGLRDFWQLPLLVLGMGGVVGAILYARAHPPKDDFAGALEQAEELVAEGELAAAKVVLFDVVGANIEKAPPEVLPRYHAVSADYVAAQVRGIEKPARENDEQVVAAYDRAKTSGWTLTSEQLVRYAQSMVRLGRAQEAFEAIEASGDSAGAEELRRQVRREALLGVLSGASGSSRSPEALLTAIDEFRADPALSAADQAWAAARAAEIRIAMRRYTDASDRLLIDLRRIEGAGEEVPAPLFAELGGLLGESLRLQGRFTEALREFEHAEGLAQAGTPVAGAIDVGMGRALLALGRHADADDAFDRAVKAEHRGALRHLALLGRAESRALLGRSSEAARDFQDLRGFVHKGEVLAETVADAERALLERADACLLDEAPEAALLYAQIAADLRPRAAAGAAALLRVATSSRETADKLLAATGAANSAAPSIDPEDRAKINRLLKQAGDAFAAHAATSEARAAQDGAYAASLWAAADCYDLAGWRDPAIANFQAFVDASQPEDLRRAEAYWRLASLNHAEGAFDEAVKGYERAIAVAPNGPFAVQSVVPLARALASSGRTADAAQRLQGVVDGTFGLEPSAAEYYEALDLLARISFEKGDFVRSAEALREAIARRPEEPRVGELNFRLGESLRSVAREAREAAPKGDVS
ncbi:MAG: tetratricopeptide repeat protein, partial [Phycisphaerales bacterium]